MSWERLANRTNRVSENEGEGPGEEEEVGRTWEEERTLELLEETGR